jgi:hypothetical protein
MKLMENRSIPGKTCPSATLSTTNHTWAGPVSNPGLRSGRPAANRLSHGTAGFICLVIVCKINHLCFLRYCDGEANVRVL